jgi:3-hydroxyacyl-CoA dehydrogenase
MLDIKTITVIGANGIVGSQMVRLLVSLLEVKVFLVCRTNEKALQTISHIYTSLQEREILGTMIPSDLTHLEDCIFYSDWVFESVTEDISIKLEMYQQIIQYLRPHTLVSTGTSSFLIRQLSDPFGDTFKKQFYGTHFFNPPDKLALMEFISTRWNDPEVSIEFEKFFKERLRRQSIIVKDIHGFLANRIGSLFLNEAALMAEQYSDRGGIEYIDFLMGRFIGRSMPPMMTIDYIGLDVFTAMLNNIQKDLQPNLDCRQRPNFYDELIGMGNLGRKYGRGMYAQTLLPDGSKEKLVFDIGQKEYRPLKVHTYPFASRMIDLQMQGDLASSFQSLFESKDEEAMLCKYLLLRYIVISYLVVEETASRNESVDIAMEDGYSWISPRKLVFLLGGSSGMQSILASDERMKKAAQGVDVSRFEAFQKPIEDSDIKFFSHVRK